MTIRIASRSYPPKAASVPCRSSQNAPGPRPSICSPFRRHLLPHSAVCAFLAASSLSLLSSCQLQPPPRAPQAVSIPPPKPKPKILYQWQGNGRKVSRIEIDIDKQKATFYAGPDEIGWATVSAGVRSTPTPVGRFRITKKVAKKRSNRYGKIYDRNGNLVVRNAAIMVDTIPEGGRFEGAPMPYFMRLTDTGIGLHGGPIPRPGRPASHGCIRLPGKFAPILYRHTAVGTSVTIKGGSSDARYSGTWVRKSKTARHATSP